VGDGGVLSSINDLIKWETNLHTQHQLPAAVIKGLTKQSKLSDGRKLTYANGLEVSTDDHAYNYSYHGGGFGGFRTFIFRVPALKASFIYLSNNTRIEHDTNWYHKNF